VAELDGEVVGWSAANAVSERACYAGVAETSVYVAEGARGNGVGKALMYRQVTEADAGDLWTLQTSIFPENRASIALHHSAGYRTLAVRSRIAQLDGVWRDTVLLERRRADELDQGADGGTGCAC
jgi:L-amino acid N-acyltransferase YncA